MGEDSARAEIFGRLRVVLCMRPINEAHIAEPGLAVVEVAARDNQTALAVQDLLATLCAIAPAERTTREPGEPGVRLRCFLDLRQAPDAGAVASDRPRTRP
jgi:hypothetical protein